MKSVKKPHTILNQVLSFQGTSFPKLLVPPKYIEEILFIPLVSDQLTVFTDVYELPVSVVYSQSFDFSIFHIKCAIQI